LRWRGFAHLPVSSGGKGVCLDMRSARWQIVAAHVTVVQKKVVEPPTFCIEQPEFVVTWSAVVWGWQVKVEGLRLRVVCYVFGRRVAVCTARPEVKAGRKPYACC